MSTVQATLYPLCTEDNHHLLGYALADHIRDIAFSLNPNNINLTYLAALRLALTHGNIHLEAGTYFIAINDPDVPNRRGALLHTDGKKITPGWGGSTPDSSNDGFLVSWPPKRKRSS